MEFITAREASEIWDISQRRVAILCAEGRVDGATLKGNMWLIPQDASKPVDARSARFQPKTPAKVKPFIKWAGGKAQILGNIRLKYPVGLGKTITKYAEPFVGGGAVLFDVLSNYNLGEVYISDINRELILTYETIRSKIDELIPYLKTFESAYQPLGEDERKEIYYNSRDRFNFLKKENSTSPELAALFIFLNRTCFNGLYRVNSKGEYNVPKGIYKNPCICDEENLRAVSKHLQDVQIVCGDYKESKSFIDNKTFAYFDPPYRPLTDTSAFTAYTQDGFGDNEQIELASFIDEMSARGAFVVVSNPEKLYNSVKSKRFCVHKGDDGMKTTQTQQVIEVMRGLGGFATFGKLNSAIDFSKWESKTPEASVRRIVQNSDAFFRIRPGLWALSEEKERIIAELELGVDNEKETEFSHTYYQGLAVEMGNFQDFGTYVPNQDKNRRFVDKPLKDVISLPKILDFSYKNLVDCARTVDVIWFNERGMPCAFFEIEHSTNIQNSLVKYYELQDFNARFYIVADIYRSRKYEEIISKSIFRQIKERVIFKSYESLSEMHSKVYQKKCAQAM